MHDSAYQPKLPLMRLVKKECISDSDEFDGGQSSIGTVGQDIEKKESVSFIGRLIKKLQSLRYICEADVLHNIKY